MEEISEIEQKMIAIENYLSKQFRLKSIKHEIEYNDVVFRVEYNDYEGCGMRMYVKEFNELNIRLLEEHFKKMLMDCIISQTLKKY